MFLTQTFTDLGSPNWVPLGAYATYVEGPLDACGHGTGGYLAVLHKAVEEFKFAHGKDLVVINTKMEIRQASGHPSYGRLALFITGDLYCRYDTPNTTAIRKGSK